MNQEDHSARLQSLALLGSYVPRKCGIATFTKDLRDALAAEMGDANTLVLAMDDEPTGYPYPDDVRFQIRAHEERDYRTAAELLNINQVDVTLVQHEYGIYGGRDGNFVLDLIRRARTPIISTLHTVLDDPTPGQAKVMRELARLSDRLVVMNQLAIPMLTETFGVEEAKIAYIPHGIPDVPFVDPSFHKDQFGFEGRTVMLTFGLLSPGKGVEYAIQALPKIVEKHPEVLYVVLGATHPHVLRDSGDAYRNNLERMVDKLGVRDNVVFHNRFVEINELINYIGAADIYVTPYLNMQQITSGTLAYTVGAGKAVVSTPYVHAKEMLADDRGKLIEPKNPDQIAEAVNALLDDDVARAAMRKRAYLYCREMTWRNVARSYIQLAEQCNAERAQRPRVVTQPRLEPDEHMAIPEINLLHLRTLTDDTGILANAIYGVPDRRYGYTTDDNAQALVAAANYHDLRRDDSIIPRLTCYLAFLRDAFNTDAKRFRNRLAYDRRWQDDIASERTHGRAVWALGIATQSAPTPSTREFATRLFNEVITPVEKFSSSRAWALSLVGMHAYLSRYGGDTHVRRLRQTLAEKLHRRFRENASDDWPWYEDVVHSDNAKVAHALILAGQWLPSGQMIDDGLRALEWLIGLQISEEGKVSVLGDAGRIDREGHRARFDQLPSEVMHLIEACHEAYRCTRRPVWVERARQLLNWFLGDNDLQAVMYDERTGGCRDELNSDGPNQNQGAKATLSWLISLISVYGLLREEKVDAMEDKPQASASVPADETVKT